MVERDGVDPCEDEPNEYAGSLSSPTPVEAYGLGSVPER